MEPVLEKIDQLTRSGYQYRAFDYFNKGLEYFRNHFGPISLLIGGALVLQLILGLIGLSGISGLLSLLLITPFIQGAMALFLRKASFGENPNVEDFGEVKDYMSQLILFNVIYALLILALFIPMMIYLSSGNFFSVILSGIDNPAAIFAYLSQMGGGTIVVLLLVLIPMAYLAIAYWWTPYLIVYLNMPAWQAMESSRKLISKQWFNHFGLALILLLAAFLFGLVISLISRAGMLYMVLQLAVSFLVTSVMYCAIFASYKDIVGVGETGEEETDVLDHLIS